ncbi:TadE/TadG family type IV pilus assembly protein [Methylobacterium sp. Leaf108]|uniref:TadE/TadG family type IV pilus assembly protein n=1 Tax=Methylobacterium sp. Leaf108 TaxID=1736256 RepID=UPI00138F1553|nr:TadE/TadG family type IV pilus assembly protein [Methylobacterium sp. Leaf108]
MPDHRRGPFWRSQDGAALVEAALVLPLLVAIVFALADLSLYFWQKSLATKAATLGVRAAIVADSVAEGPGLTPAESASYWFGLPPGALCWPGAADQGGVLCPSFSVTCGPAHGCACPEVSCRFGFSQANLAPILTVMQAVLPRLKPDNLRITYATNGLGYVGRPPPVPVDVTVRIVDLAFDPIFAGLLFARSLPLDAAVTLPGEDLVTGR